MLEYAGSQRAGLSREQHGIALWHVLRSVDWLLLAGVGGLVAVGLWGIAGVTKFDVPGDPRYYLDKQIIYAGAGGFVLLVALLLDPDLYRRYWKVIFGTLVGLIAVVFLAGHASHGSTRWINVGFFTFQPSEFGKLLCVLGLAGFLAERQRLVGSVGTTAKALGLGLIPTLLVFVQPDLGTALVYLAALAAMLFVAGSPWRHLTALGAAAAAIAVVVLWLGPALGVNFLKPYQKERLICFTHPATCPVDARYNVEQSIAAVGSGEVRGRGPNGATQTRLDFLPEHHTDFVFASFAEQRGFLGASFLLALYLLVLWRGLRVVAVARDLYSAVVAGGIVVALLFQIFVNVGMTMGVAPITGIPLPFVSVGGSSMIANLGAMGVLLAIHARGRASRSLSRRRG
ncbi:MAG: rod shape-determining protein RodA [Actinobacteria bacterium]|nr:rod shape-determining protein RodA [Actinomycetota bacterium]